MKNSLLLIGLTCMLIACNRLDQKFNRQKVKWNTYVKKDAFGIQYPDFLIRDTSLAAFATVAFDNKTLNFFVMVVEETKDTLRSYGYWDISLEEYKELVKLGSDSTAILNLLSEKKAKVNGLNAIELAIEQDLTAVNNGVKTFTHFKKLVVEGKRGFYQICIWCLKQDYDKYKKDFDGIVKSFKEL
jgi:hypothetical protein